MPRLNIHKLLNIPGTIYIIPGTLKGLSHCSKNLWKVKIQKTDSKKQQTFITRNYSTKLPTNFTHFLSSHTHTIIIGGGGGKIAAYPEVLQLFNDEIYLVCISVQKSLIKVAIYEIYEMKIYHVCSFIIIIYYVINYV